MKVENATKTGYSISEERALSLLEGDPTKAASILVELIKSQPNRLRLLRPYARLLMRSMDFETARECWERIDRLASTDIEPKMALARIHVRSQRPVEALAWLCKVLKRDSEHEEARKLHDRVSSECLERIVSQISPGNAAEFDKLLSKLEPLIGDNPLVGQLKAYVRYFSTVAPARRRRQARRLVESSLNRTIPDLIKSAEKLAHNEQWGDYLDLAEEVLGAAGLSEEATEFFVSQRGRLTALAPQDARAHRMLELTAVIAKAKAHRPTKTHDYSKLGFSKRAAEAAAAQNWPMLIEALEEFAGSAGITAESISFLQGQRLSLQAILERADAALAGRAQRLLDMVGPREFETPEFASASRRRLAGSRRKAPAWSDLPMASKEEELERLLHAVRSETSLLHEQEWSDAERSVLRLAVVEPWLAAKVVGFYLDNGLKKKAVEVYLQIEPESSESAFWMGAVRVAAELNNWEAVVVFADRAIEVASSVSATALDVAAMLGEFGQPDQAISVLRRTPGYVRNLRLRLGVVRLLYGQRRDAEVLEEGTAILRNNFPTEEQGVPERQTFMEAVRRVAKSAARGELASRIVEVEAIVREAQPASALTCWVLGTLAMARGEPGAALHHFEEGRRYGSGAAVGVNFEAEIALLHIRLQEFGKARREASLIPAGTALTSEQRSNLQRLAQVAEFCGAGDDLLYPECLVDIIFDELRREPIRYLPQTNYLLTVLTSLDQGGSERQTVTVLSKLATDPRLAKLALAVRSTDSEQKSFFLPTVREMPLDLFLYGKNWRTKSIVTEMLPELKGRSRLAGAIDLLPHGQREDVVRLCRLIFDERPQAVHIRQDLYAAALACAIAGVPNFLLHRGSLSPDLWGYSEIQTFQHLRPMRHIYRQLMTCPHFLIVNNSKIGSETDRNWTGHSDARRFAVVHNAYDFEQLGESLGRNLELRAKLGIAADDIVVGTAFRFVAVKRPMLWIEIAHCLLKRLPSTHFLIMGDGPMMEEVRNYAAVRGFAERLHLPGRVSNVAEWYQAMDINLLTSDREGLPNVLIEGQHFGVPVIASDVGGAVETIEVGKTGYLIRSDASADAFAEAIFRIAQDSRWLAAARQRSPEFVHMKFSAEQTVNEILRLLGFVT